MRKLTEAQEAVVTKERRKELLATNMIANQNINFASTYVVENKSSNYASNIKLKSLADARSVNDERKRVDHEILATVGLRKSNSNDSISSILPSGSEIEKRPGVSSSIEYRVNSPSTELQKVLAEINGLSTSETRPNTSNSSVSRPGTSQSAEHQSPKLSPIPDASLHTSLSLPDVQCPLPISDPSLSSPNTRGLSSSPSTTFLRPINIVKTHNSLLSPSPTIGERTRLLTNRAMSEPSFSKQQPRIKLPTKELSRGKNIRYSSNNNPVGSTDCSVRKPSENVRKAKSSDDLEKMVLS